MSHPCPRCKQLLAIPKPAPAKIQCPKCSAIIRLGANPASNSQSNPVLALSRHDMTGKSLPPEMSPLAPAGRGVGVEGASPFTLPAEDTPPRTPNRGRGLVLALILLLLVGGGGASAYFLFKGKDAQPIAPKAPIVDIAQLDKASTMQYEKADIQGAVERGVVFLKKRLLEDNDYFYRSDMQRGNASYGAAALAGLTLLECGVPADDPAVQKAVQVLRNAANDIHATYTLSTAILFLDRLHQEQRKIPASDVKLLETFAYRLLAGQDKTGFWGYGQPVSPEEAEQARATLQSGQPVAKDLWYINLSNSQFSALALWAARKHGVPVKPALKKVNQAAREKQTKDGTWHYDLNLPMHHSSVCAGLIFLALERGIEDQPVRKGPNVRVTAASTTANTPIPFDDPAIAKALDYLGKLVGKTKFLSTDKRAYRQEASHTMQEYYRTTETGRGKPPVVSWTPDFAFHGTIFGADSWGDLYFLWSIERVAMIYELKKIGGKDWYAWGSGIIVAHQKQDGSWEDRFPGVPDTCFALLFLKRANLFKDLTDKLRESASWDILPAGPIPADAPAPKRKQ
ncbi:MAG: hypothetical protein L0215_14405 [Gemmataceae bacterium]|nr:hypothetical protein [Gemmataceae bacterium]